MRYRNEEKNMKNPLEGLQVDITIKILKKKAIVSAEYESGDKTYVYKGGHCYLVNKAETAAMYCWYDDDSINFYKSQKKRSVKESRDKPKR
jgi:hypothetical protein